MRYRYYAVVNANTGEQNIYFDSWDNVEPLVKGKSNFIYKAFDSEKAAQDFANQGYVEKNDIDWKNSEAVNKEIEDRINSLTDDEAIIVTDGSYMEKVNKDISGAGWIEISKDHHEPKNATCPSEGMRNVAGEIKAAEEGIKWAIDNKYKRLDIYCDFKELIDWAYGYQVNTDISKKYYDLLKETNKKMKLSFHKVSAHKNVKYNEEVDRLAKSAIENYKK